MATDPRHSQTGGKDLQDSDAAREEAKEAEFFGFELEDSKTDPDGAKSFIAPQEENESAEIMYGNAGGFFGQTMDTRGDNYASERDLIAKYRNAAMQPEVDAAIQEIVNETIVNNDEDLPISLNLDHVDLDESIKEKLHNEFDHIIKKLEFRKYGSDIFRRWYIDGKCVYHIVIDLNNPQKGIIELRPINPTQIRKIKEIEREKDPRTGADFIKSVEEYYVYSEDQYNTNASTNTYGTAMGGHNQTGLKLAKDTVTYVTSGLTDASRAVSLSYLHKALRCINQLRMMEDALIVYRTVRAPERRIFSIDVGDMPKKQAEEYINNLMSKYKNKITYDADTGEINSNRHHQHMLEDFWLPKTASGKGTEVSTLAGGENLGNITDVEYFQQRLYKALNVPVGRLTPSEQTFQIGKNGEIDREEIRFQKFIDRLRVRFGQLFKDLLRTQLILKGIIKEHEWEDIREDLIVDYNRDNYYSELKDVEILKERINTLKDLGFNPTEFFSREYIRKHILKQTDDEVDQIKDQMRKEYISNDNLFRKMEDGGGEFGADDFGGGGLDAVSDFGDIGGEGDLGGDTAFEPGEPAGAATDIDTDVDAGGPDIDLDDL
jgi:hypothetical protein